MRPWIDISQRLIPTIPVWPGDTPFSYQLSWTKAESGSVNVGKITMSTHTGTHIDAPYHFDENGKKVIELDINLYIGVARLIVLKGIERISSDVFKNHQLEGVSRLLIRTDAWRDKSAFPMSIPYIDPELAPFLANHGIKLLGLDIPSVDPLDSKELPAHHSLTQHGVHILEGLILDELAEGEYELIALPLPLAEADGSPVRAVLREIE